MLKKRLNDEELAQLRGEVVMCSLFINDYKNSFGYDPNRLCDFFDAYADYLQAEMNDDGLDGDNRFYDYIAEYDTTENLSLFYNEILDDESFEYYFGESEKRDKIDVLTDVLTGAAVILTIGVMVVSKMILSGALW